jgi:tetratricopeptide (TPR) repeat protein
VRKLSTALWAAGELAEAEALRGEVLEAAVSAGDKRMQWYAVVDGLMRGANGVSEEDQARLADEAIAVFTGLDDDLGLARVWRFKSLLPNARRRLTEGAEAVERSLFHASRAGDPREVARAVYSLCTTLLDGPTPVGEAISRCEEILARRGTTPLIEAGVSTHLAGLKAMQGNFEEARRLGLRAEEIFDGLGLRLAIVNLAEAQAGVELLAGDPEEAEAALRKGYEILAREDPPSLTAPLAAMLAEAALEQGHAEQAEELLRAANQAEEIDSRVRSLRVRARLQAQRGDVERALGLAREAVQLASESDALNLRADTHVVLAGVLQAASRDDEAERELRTAVELYERKGNAVAAARAAALLAKDRLGIPPRGR